MRRSHEGLSGIFKDNYKELPDNLKPFNYYYNDGETGHVIMAIPTCLLSKEEEDGDLDMFECPFPVKYVLEKGYIIHKNHIICNGEYTEFGLEIDDSYYEV